MMTSNETARGETRTARVRATAWRREGGVLALLALTVIGVAVINPTFLALNNVRDILVQAAPAAIVACGLTFVILTGEIDISVGAMMGLLAAVLGTLTSSEHLGWPVALGIAVTLAMGTGIGLVNGLLVTLGRVPSIIVTLGMMTMLQGVTEIVMGGEWIKALPPGLRFWGMGAIAGVPVAVGVAVLVALFCMGLARETPLGRRIYAVGSNPHAARLAGLKTHRVKLFVFTFTGFLTAVATLVSVPRLSVIESGIGRGFELLVVTAVVVGGTSVSGGRGSIVGSLLAVLLLGTVGTALIFLRLGESATYWERAIQGAFILLAVLADHLARRRVGAGA